MESGKPPKNSGNKTLVPKSKKSTGALAVKKPKGSTSIAPSDPLLATYFREISRYPLLTKEEEHELAMKYYQTRDRETLQKLVTSNLRFVVKIAYEYHHYRIRLMDLIQEGNTGLIRAVQDFNPFKEVRLTTYAVWWIRSYIQEAILKNFSLVKMGTTQAQKKLFYQLKKEQKKLEDMGMAPGQNVKLLASKLDVKEKEVEEMSQRLSGPDISLNAQVGDDERKEHIQNIADPGAPVDQRLGDEEQAELFKTILNQFGQTLEGREKIIFQNRLISENPLTLQEIGNKYKVSKERARQLEEQVKEKLKKYVAQHYPDFNLLTE
ncbi:MAG: sigma-70 family RNA polymerase sigma factor [Proteobacteria bacterium]|nr:sigma-70 family RNA polymerase sigma factor [Pseudomonadota bacterium]NDD05375.1 sigma-70 family RNA polymerase sigma factor [Pseudomonadota bacterium]NDG26773.1 sigma-70 family RNA polymerase sigma factor [Pseudomonadota bacterium]